MFLSPIAVSPDEIRARLLPSRKQLATAKIACAAISPVYIRTKFGVQRLCQDESLRRFARLCIFTGCWAIVPATAADSLMSQTPASEWIITLGGTATVSPAYPGASGIRPGFTPSLTWSKPGDTPQFHAPEDGVDLTAYQSAAVKFGATFGFDGGRYSADSPRLAGLKDVPWTINSGLFAEFWPISNRFRTRIELSHGFRQTDGFTANLSAYWVEQFGELTLSGGPRVALADRTQMQSRFGVTPAEALTSGYVAYNPRGGLKSVGVGLAQSYKLNPSWTGILYQHYDRLAGSAGKSPLVENGNRNQFSIGAGMTYSFGIGGK